MKQIDICELKENLSYNEESGVFTWIKGAAGRPKIGSVAGTVRPDGYVAIRLSGVVYLAHRLAWCYVHGEIPDAILDHINMNRSDNRIANLRLSSKHHNACNTGVISSNTTGLPGVCFIGKHRPRSKKVWQSNICVNGKKVTIGRYETSCEAFQAYINAKKVLHSGIGIEHITDTD